MDGLDCVAERPWIAAGAWCAGRRRTVTRDFAKEDASERMHRLPAPGPSQEDALTSGELDSRAGRSGRAVSAIPP